jgi:hypothetical protein
MRVQVRIQSDVDEYLAGEIRRGERAVKVAMSAAAADLKAGWRQQVTTGSLGRRLASSIRSEAYPKGADSLNAAGLVWTKAPKLIDAFNRGVVIRSANGFWLAIPTKAAGPATGRFGRPITPAVWEQRTGRRLRFVYRRGRNALLVADDARINSRGFAAAKGGRRRRDGILSGAQTVVIFTLVRQAKLKKRLDLERDVARVGSAIPARIVAEWGDT